MIFELLAIALFSWGVVALTYILYSALVLKTRKKARYLDTIHRVLLTPVDPKELPPVTILIPVHNEEQNIVQERKSKLSC
jgi:cellulose synthase/poly-beta-1,6-N-acetylglucosamine synthase-like glycosyltransferase